MAYDAFLKIDGITGPNTRSSIEVLSFSFGVTDGGDRGGGGGGGRVGRATEIDFSFACATGKILKSADLSLTQPNSDGTPTEFYKLHFTGLLVDSDQTNGSEEGDDKPLETVQMDYESVEIWSDGQRAGYNFKLNKSF
jgi:type VI protein secretion system component Hcp